MAINQVQMQAGLSLFEFTSGRRVNAGPQGQERRGSGLLPCTPRQISRAVAPYATLFRCTSSRS